MVAVESSRQSQGATTIEKPRWTWVIWLAAGSGLLLTIAWITTLGWLLLQTSQAVWHRMII
jgi:hypothetical protein